MPALSTIQSTPLSLSYFVVMIRRGRGLEAIVNPEETRRDIVSLILSGEYDRERIIFIHEVRDGQVENVTDDIMAEVVWPHDERVAA